jgi:FKBP-type peptidyl-prolyl cis-trans isomerase SlyD
MEITQQCVVALTWTLKDTLGEELDVLDEPVEFLVGGEDLLHRIEEALQGHGPGATLALHLEPEDAFGDFNDQLLFLEPRELFPPEIEEGMTFDGSALPEGVNPTAPRSGLYTVTEIYPEHQVLDGNLHLPESPALRHGAKAFAKPQRKNRQRHGGTGFSHTTQAPGNLLPD